MPELREFIDTLLEEPFIRAFGALSERLRMRFALRGGLLRNLLFSYSRDGYGNHRFYEFVDPFSDIDLVVDDLGDWPRLAQTIISSIPFAGFHHWEVITAEAMREASKSYATISADRLLLWFDGREGRTSNVFLEGLDITAEDVVGEPVLQLDLESFGRRRGEVDTIDRMLDALRYARYSAAFPDVRRNIDPAELLERLTFRDRVSDRSSERTPQNSIDRRRLETSILDLMFTASDWKRASELLDITRNALPPVWIETSRLLRSVFYHSDLTKQTGIGAVTYSSKPQSKRLIRLISEAKAPRLEAKNIPTMFPWVRLSCSGHKPGDCCGYSDFQCGVATIAWRRKDSNSKYSNLPETGFGAVAAVLPPRGEYARQPRQNEEPFLSVPAYVRRGKSLVVRVDHGYVGGLLNRNVIFYFGLVPATK